MTVYSSCVLWCSDCVFMFVVDNLTTGRVGTLHRAVLSPV